MLGDIKTVAQGTFDRYFKMKELYVILILCILNIAALSRYDVLTLNMGKEFMIDGALAILTVVALITSMAVIFEKSRELREKTAHFIITKPYGRSSYIWGKFIGISFLAIFNMAILTAGALIVFKLTSYENVMANNLATEFIYAALLITAEAIVLTALGLFFSMFLSDTITALMVLVFFILGHSFYILEKMSSESSKIFGWVSDILPNLHNLDLKSAITDNITITQDVLGYGLLYAVLYAVAFVAASSMIFSRKDIS